LYYFFLLPASPILLDGYKEGHAGTMGLQLRKYMSLPVVPEQDMWSEVNKLKKINKVMARRKHREAMKTFHDNYIVGFWMRKIGPRRLSVYNAVPKTNNACESLHSKMSHLLPSHGSYLKFFLKLMEQFMVPTAALIGQLDNGLFTIDPYRNNCKKLKKAE